MGLAVRLHDKVARLAHQLNHGDPGGGLCNETLRDTLLDISNYGLIGVMVFDEAWPEG